MEGIGTHFAGVSGGEVLIGYIWYVLLRIFVDHDKFRLR